jgi:hypothetical protein
MKIADKDQANGFFNWFPWALRGVYPPPAYERRSLS